MVCSPYISTKKDTEVFSVKFWQKNLKSPKPEYENITRATNLFGK